MAVLKCSMCGGTIIPLDQTIGECESCGRILTIPKIDSDQKLKMLNRASTMRRNKNFDAAFQEYERILRDDQSDPDVYWGALLAHFGIEYVQDPASGEYKPTMHRMQFQAMKEHGYYLKIMSLSYGRQREIYEANASEIDQISERYMTIMNAQPAYDVFISYKDKDDAGVRTRDSCDAEEIYQMLTKKRGYRVFFSRETLKDVAGEEYEPYIFAALNRAKVMLLYGSDEDYIQSTWVKNEWQRYRFLQRNDSSKHLIPVLKNLEPDYLPPELAKLQAFDYLQPQAQEKLLKLVDNFINPTVGGQQGGGYTLNVVNIVRQGLNLAGEAKFAEVWKAIQNAEQADYTHLSVTVLKIVYYTMTAMQAKQAGKKERYMQAMNTLKSYRSRLMEKGISKDEQEFYDKLDSPEAYAVLTFCYDFCVMKDRVQIVRKLTHPDRLYSPFCCRMYLDFLVRMKSWKEIDLMLGGSFSTAGGFALRRILEHYPESAQKSVNIRRILQRCPASGFTPDDMARVEMYFDRSDDSIDSKFEIIMAIHKNGLPYSVFKTLEQFSGKLPLDKQAQLIDAMCNSRLTDADIKTMFKYCAKQNYDVIALFLKKLSEEDKFLLFDYERLSDLVESEHMSAEEKLKLLDMIEEYEKFRFDSSGVSAFVQHYVCEGNFSREERRLIIEKFLEISDHFPAKTVERYVMECSLDGMYKPVVLGKILSKDINKASLRTLIQKYAAAGKDSPEVAEQVVEMLIQNGFAVGEDAFEKMLMANVNNNNFDSRKFRILIRNGSEASVKSLSIYLENVKPEKYSDDMLDLMYRDDCRVSDEALAVFVLYVKEEQCRDKSGTAELLAGRNLDSFGQSSCRIHVGGDWIICNLLQAYLILDPDPDETREKILRQMSGAVSDLKNSVLRVGSDMKKFKAYLMEHRNMISESTIKTCKDYGVFGRFDRI